MLVGTLACASNIKSTELTSNTDPAELYKDANTDC